MSKAADIRDCPAMQSRSHPSKHQTQSEKGPRSNCQLTGNRDMRARGQGSCIPHPGNMTSPHCGDRADQIVCMLSKLLEGKEERAEGTQRLRET